MKDNVFNFIKKYVKEIIPSLCVIALVTVAVCSGGADIEKLPEKLKESAENSMSENSSEAKKVMAAELKDEKNKKEKKRKKKKIDLKDAVYKDGVYKGVAEGFGGDIEVKVTVKKGKISAIKIVSAAKETPEYFNKAKVLTGKIISEQNPSVDAVSGATYSSDGIINAVKTALLQAAKDKNSKDLMKKTSEKKKSKKANKKNSKAKTTEKKVVKKADTSNLKDGEYIGTGTGFGGEIQVKVLIKKGKIKKITIISAVNETPEYFAKAKTIVSSIVKSQSASVDAVSGATYSSNGIKEAVNNALLKAQKKDKKKDDSKDTGKKDTADKKDTTDKSGDKKVTENNADKESGEWTQLKSESDTKVYPVKSYCEPFDDDFVGYEINFNIMITTEITKYKNTIGQIRIVTNVYVSGVELTKETADYAVSTGNWAFLNMAANGIGAKAGLFEQFTTKNSVKSLDAVSGATCSSNALISGMRATVKDIKLGKTVEILTEAEAAKR